MDNIGQPILLLYLSPWRHHVPLTFHEPSHLLTHNSQLLPSACQASMPGLLFQPLLRHGNHAMRQVAMRRESTPLVVEQDFETLGGLCVVWWMGVPGWVAEVLIHLPRELV